MITAVSFQLAGILVAIGFREIAKAEISVNGSPAGKRGGLASSLHVILGDPSLRLPGQPSGTALQPLLIRG